MKIIAHRGVWKKINEKNTKKAFEKALEFDFGIELDIRLLNGEIYISHDHQNCDKDLYLFRDFIKNTYKEFKNYLAINIKEDGIADKLNKILIDNKIENYFVFDMSFPEQVIYSGFDLNVWPRFSEYESPNNNIVSYNGYWVDFFHGDTNYSELITDDILNFNFAFVSPELHGNDPKKLWHYIKNNLDKFKNEIFLCTDLPFEAKTFFGRTK